MTLNVAEAVGFEPTTQGVEIPCAIQTALRPGKLNRVNVLDNCIMSAVYKVFAGSLLKIAYSN